MFGVQEEEMKILDMNNKDNIQKNCHKILSSYDLPTTYLGDVLNRHYIKKQWMLDALGIKEEDGFRKVFALANTVDTRPLAVGLLRDIEKLSEGKYRMLDLQFMWREKNKIRVTKVIQEMWSRLCDDTRFAYEQCGPNTQFGICCGEARIAHPVNMYSGPSDAEQYIHRFHVWYGDYVKNGRVAVLSFNPFDFIMASDCRHEFCGFTSCVRPDGEYANTILDYLASDCVAIMYTAKPEEMHFKEGRCWVYINPNAVFQGRVYGSIFDSDLLLVRDYIQQKLVPDDNYELFGGEDRSSISKWTRRSKAIHLDGADCNNRGVAYVDYGYGIMSVTKGSELKEYFTISKGICLECGEDLDGYEAGYTCSDCSNDGYRCLNCGESMSEDDTYYIGDSGPYCEACFDDMAFQCDHCGESHHNDFRVGIENGGDVCEDCFNEDGFTCSKCECNFMHTGAFGHRESITNDIDGEPYCERCAERYLVTCEECGEKVHTDNINSTQDDVYLCDGCYKDATHESVDNKIFHSEDERDRYNEENSDTDRQINGKKIAACG